MSVGDLVWLNKEMFYDHDEFYGIILEIIENPDGQLIKVAWDSGETAWFHNDELEVVYEGR
tara:strand:+ start:284 stop:466 length:183 start_codon:yes stop_codon:yes gene_type:complete